LDNEETMYKKFDLVKTKIDINDKIKAGTLGVFSPLPSHNGEKCRVSFLNSDQEDIGTLIVDTVSLTEYKVPSHKNKVESILSNYDFTDSIVTNVLWENNLSDLSLTIDYYWDYHVQKKKKILKMTFHKCSETNFRSHPLSTKFSDKKILEENYQWSWFTITSFKFDEDEKNKDLLKIAIHTYDYQIPWLSVTCKDMRIEDVTKSRK